MGGGKFLTLPREIYKQITKKLKKVTSMGLLDKNITIT